LKYLATQEQSLGIGKALGSVQVSHVGVSSPVLWQIEQSCWHGVHTDLVAPVGKKAGLQTQLPSAGIIFILLSEHFTQIELSDPSLLHEIQLVPHALQVLSFS
jgi:hypothetical protein